MTDLIRKKAMTPKQAKVMRILRAGGLMVEQYGKSGRYRLLDAKRNPINVIQARTFSALNNSERIIKSDFMWIANQKRRISKQSKN